MIRALFENYDTAKAYGLHQWDYGQVLRIEGLKLPTAIEIHFSLQETGGEAVTRIGVTKDSVTDVVIPDSMLENNATTQDYTIYAYIYLADQTSGQTIKKITMPVTARPRPEIWDTPEDADLFREAIAAVNSSAERAEKAAESIGGYVDTAKADIDEYVAGKEVELRGAPGEPGAPGAPGEKGDPGEPGQPGTTPHIGDNGHWWIGDVDTGVVAGGGGGTWKTLAEFYNAEEVSELIFGSDEAPLNVRNFILAFSGSTGAPNSNPLLGECGYYGGIMSVDNSAISLTFYLSDGTSRIITTGAIRRTRNLFFSVDLDRGFCSYKSGFFADMGYISATNCYFSNAKITKIVVSAVADGCVFNAHTNNNKIYLFTFGGR